MTDLRPTLFICGVLLATLAVIMSVPALADGIAGSDDWQAFAGSAIATLFFGGVLVLVNRAPFHRLSVRQAFVLTSLAWVLIAAFGALPLAFSSLGMSYADAFFEAMSGITTTGSTVIVGLDQAPPGILLWRALLQWLGGIGIVVVAVGVLPKLQIGGMQLFKVEAFDTPEKVLPRAAQIALGIAGAYLGLTILFAVLLWITGMSPFDAVVHAMTGIATGGFSTRDASIGYFDNGATDWVMVGCMIAGGLPFVYYLDLARGRWRPVARDSQVRTFLVILAIAAIVVALWLWRIDHVPFWHSLTQSGFNVVSIMTGTGYATENFDRWGGLPIVVLFMLMFIGGCAGSTTCGIKVFRFQIAYAVARSQIGRLLQPHGVFIPTYNRRPITRDVAVSVMGFFFLFTASFAVLAATLGVLGLDFITSISGAATAIANVGPGFGDIIGPAGNFRSLPDAAKWVLSAGMLLGRLELFTVLILFTPSFWRA